MTPCVDEGGGVQVSLWHHHGQVSGSLAAVLSLVVVGCYFMWQGSHMPQPVRMVAVSVTWSTHRKVGLKQSTITQLLALNEEHGCLWSTLNDGKKATIWVCEWGSEGTLFDKDILPGAQAFRGVSLEDVSVGLSAQPELPIMGVKCSSCEQSSWWLQGPPAWQSPKTVLGLARKDLVQRGYGSGNVRQESVV